MDRRPSFPTDFQLFVASRSPRRHDYLRAMGVPFVVVESDAVEVLTGADVCTVAEANALAKLRAAVLPAGAVGGAFVLAIDTIVSVRSAMMGKASSEAEARAMLRELSGRMHQVVSGVALGRVGEEHGGVTVGDHAAVLRGIAVDSAVTDVMFIALSDEDIDAYILSGEWEDKAGAYAIQGLAGLYATQIRGEYSNVVGFPLSLVGRMFREQGFDLVRRAWL